MAEEAEINIIIEQLKALPIPTSEKIKTLEELLEERGITEKKPYIERLLT
jgi:hypothetical protein